jgi:hypothetical protein
VPADYDTVQEILENLVNLDSIRRLTGHLVFETEVDRGERFSKRYETSAAQA